MVSMFFREYPPDRGYLVYAGLEDLLDYLDAFRFEERDIEYLRTSGRFDGCIRDLASGLTVHRLRPLDGGRRDSLR